MPKHWLQGVERSNQEPSPQWPLDGHPLVHAVSREVAPNIVEFHSPGVVIARCVYLFLLSHTFRQRTQMPRNGFKQTRIDSLGPQSLTKEYIR